MALAHIAHYYPGIPIVSSAWDTRDHWIPWRLVGVLYKRLYAVLALDRLNQIEGVYLGEAKLWGKPSQVKSLIRQVLNEAHPDG